MLLAEKSSEIFPKHKVYYFILESLVLDWQMLVVLTNKKVLLPL